MKYVQIEEAAQILCCSTRTIRRKLNKVNKDEFSKIIDGRLFVKRAFVDHLQGEKPIQEGNQLYFVLYSKTQDCYHVIKCQDFNYANEKNKGWQRASSKYMTFEEAQTFIQLRDKWMRENYKITIDFERIMDGDNTRLLARNITVDGEEQEFSFLLWLSNSIMFAAQQQRTYNGEIKGSSTAKKSYRNGFVYLMIDKNTNYYKIGFSKDPKHREKTLQSEKPTIELLHKFKGTMKEEKELHEKYADKRIRGEWFDLTQKDIDYIKSL